MTTNNIAESWQFNKDLFQRNKHMLDNELATDVTFKVSASPTEYTRTFKAHKYMLISASPVFWAMFCGELPESGDVQVSDVDPQAFRHMLRYIYTDNPTISGNNVMQILHAAKKYQLPDLVELCKHFLDAELCASNACAVLEHSLFFNETDLVQKCIKKIEENTTEAFSSYDFMTISKDTLSVILESDKLSMKEVNIFNKCYDWAIRKAGASKSAREILGLNLFQIRFPTLSSEEFADIVCPKNILTKDEQLEVLLFLSSAKKDKIPGGFCCIPRKPEFLIKEGDRVRLQQPLLRQNPFSGRLTKIHCDMNLTVVGLNDEDTVTVNVHVRGIPHQTVYIGNIVKIN